jgi:iron-sulfur cluster repair protein YtfE (RIC family)
MLALRQLIDDGSREPSLVTRLELFCDELLDHFANEEEALFPFVRAHHPSYGVVIDALVEAHDVLCANVVRLAHAAKRGMSPDALRRTYATFQALYAKHSRDEAALLENLHARLSPEERRALNATIHGATA